ncbi:MAG: tuaH 1 [Gemmataceae bacterium]|nr:tuaH 1 [Gemmataceae bacterium]
MPDPAPLIVFADDWGRHPSSCQHLVSHLLPRRPVVWVNTIGTRPPRLNWSTVARGIEKLKQWARTKPEPSSPPRVGAGRGEGVSPHILNPAMWPSFRSRVGRGLNRRLLTRVLRPVAEAMPRPPVVVATIPLVADLVGAVPAARWVYYCVDDFGVWPGLDGRTIRGMEAELVAKVDTVVAVSQTLQAHVAKLGKPSHLLTHGVDLDHFRSPVEPDAPAWVGGLSEFATPLVVFWGVIDRRTDLAFVRRLGEAMTEGTILLVGPQDDPDPELFRFPRVRTLPPIPYADLPVLAARAAVLVMPYADLPVTRAMQPLKLKEYLATGKPVVVRKLPATELWADCLDAADTPDGFASTVLDRLRTGVPDAQRAARARLDAEGWAAKAEEFERWIDGESMDGPTTPEPPRAPALG